MELNPRWSNARYENRFLDKDGNQIGELYPTRYETLEDAQNNTNPVPVWIEVKISDTVP